MLDASCSESPACWLARHAQLSRRPVVCRALSVEADTACWLCWLQIHFEDFRMFSESFGMQLDDDSLLALYYVHDPDGRSGRQQDK